MSTRVCFVVLALIFAFAAAPTSAHEINPEVIERITGEEISYDHTHDDVSVAGLESDPRYEARTFYSFPEWYIVYSAQEYANFVTAGNRPSQFPFFAAIKQMWQSWQQVEALAGEAPDATTTTVLQTIAVSFSVEYGVVGIYENTIGRLSEWIALGQPTIEEVVIAKNATEYGDFLLHTPWFGFSYKNALQELWTNYSWKSVTPRGVERRVAYTVGYSLKAGYAAVVRWLWEGGVVAKTSVVVTDPNLLPETVANEEGSKDVSFPRYRAFLAPAVTYALAGGDFVSIVGNMGDITLSVVTTDTTTCPALRAPETMEMTILTQPGLSRVLLVTTVPALGDTIRALAACGIDIEHIYDY